MAITVLTNGVTAEVTLAGATEFTVDSAAIVTADGLAIGENAVVYRLGPSGNYVPATNEKGSIVLSTYPNMALIDGPATYKITKDATGSSAYIGYEE